MDVVALGELLIDFTENGTSAQDNKLFEANPGGLHVTCLPCFKSSVIRLLSSEKWDRMRSEGCLLMP